MARRLYKGGTVTELSSGRPSKLRKVPAWLRVDQLAALDQEIMARKAKGEDRNEEGERINVNRSLLIREIIDEHYKRKGT